MAVVNKDAELVAGAHGRHGNLDVDGVAGADHLLLFVEAHGNPPLVKDAGPHWADGGSQVVEVDGEGAVEFGARALHPDSLQPYLGAGVVGDFHGQGAGEVLEVELAARGGVGGHGGVQHLAAYAVFYYLVVLVDGGEVNLDLVLSDRAVIDALGRESPQGVGERPGAAIMIYIYFFSAAAMILNINFANFVVDPHRVVGGPVGTGVVDDHLG